jgi:hypothetical protein
MNKIIQWLQSIKSRVTGAFSHGKDPAPSAPVIPPEAPDARRERIIKNVFPILTKTDAKLADAGEAFNATKGAGDFISHDRG